MSFGQVLQPYEDPLIKLIKDPELNRSKQKSNELLNIINNFQSKELNKIKRKCIHGFQILRDLEKLEMRSKNWEFLSLDFSIENLLQNDLFEKDNNDSTTMSAAKIKFNQEIAKKVLQNCVEMHAEIQCLVLEIDEINVFIRNMKPWEYISDPGTILTQLILRCINLKTNLSDQLTILYSKAKLINIGIDLEMLLEKGPNFESLTDTTVESYRDFINQLLRQLNDAIETNDSIEIMECIEIVNDVEQMFDSISLPSAMSDNNLIKEEAEPEHDHEPEDSFISSSSDDDQRKLFDSNNNITNNDSGKLKTKRRLSISSVSTAGSPLHKTSLQDELPHLLNAFDNAKSVEEEIREARSVPGHSTTRSVAVPIPKTSSSPTTATPQMSSSVPSMRKSVNFGPLQEQKPSSHHPIQETFISQLSNSYIFDNNSSFLNKLGIRPQVIQIDSASVKTQPKANAAAAGAAAGAVQGKPMTYSRLGHLTERNLQKLENTTNNTHTPNNDNEDDDDKNNEIE